MFTWRAFVPQPDNDYTPDVFQRRAVLLMVFLVLLTFLISNMWALLWQQSEWLVGAVLPAVVITETNNERSRDNVPTLRRNPVLDAAAQLKAEDMAANKYFAHYSPRGISPWHWFAQAGYSFVHAGENLAVHFTDSDTVVDAWMNSPTHRANIVNANFTEIGVGTARGNYEGFDTVFVVQLFGTPAWVSANTSAVASSSPDRALAQADVVDTGVLSETAPIVARPLEDVAGVVRDVPLLDAATTPEEVMIPAPVEVAVTETMVTENGVVIVSDTIASSTDLPRAPYLVSTEVVNYDNVGWWGAFTSPRHLIQILYGLLGCLVVGLLFTSVCVEWRQQRPRQLLYGIGLLLLMSALFYIHVLVTSGVAII